MPRVSTSALHSLRGLALFFLATGLQAQSTWNLTPVDNSWATAANWSNGIAPIGTTATAVFGNSTVTSITISLRLAIGELQFTSAATTPYTLNFTATSSTSSSTTRVGNIVNNSSWAPTLTFRDNHVTQLHNTTFADANLIFNNTALLFNGFGGTATIQMNGGTLYYLHNGGNTDGQNARLILNGG